MTTETKQPVRPPAQGTTAPAPMKRKFVNPTPSYVGANVMNHKNEPHAIAVEPGGEVWLTEIEERMTAEAPRLPQDNPFVKEWEAVVERHPETGDPIKTETRKGVLIPSDEPARPIGSGRFTPSGQDAHEPEPEPVPSPESADTSSNEPAGPVDTAPAPPLAEEAAVEVTAHETLTGAQPPPDPSTPPVEGKAAPNEVVATPEAVAANDEEIARRKAADETVPVEGRVPSGAEQIGIPPPRSDG